MGPLLRLYGHIESVSVSVFAAVSSCPVGEWAAAGACGGCVRPRRGPSVDLMKLDLREFMESSVVMDLGFELLILSVRGDDGGRVERRRGRLVIVTVDDIALVVIEDRREGCKGVRNLNAT
jgi:hypothetical protein